MADDEPAGPELAAGDFATWLGEMRAALRGERASDVPCGECTACCTSAQFVHIEPDEHDALAHIPAELLFPAPMQPRGHLLLGYDERGHCPMLVDGACSIYAHRPRTCRTYDCRVFAATGVEVEGDEKTGIARQVRRWRFSYPTPEDRAARESVHVAVTFLRSEAVTPMPPTQLAIRAIEACEPVVRSEPRSRDDHDDDSR
jgi:uncharacterized protein